MHVKDGIRAAGGTPMEFNTVSISDGITMGTEGMRASLVSREVIADSIELVTRGNGFDGLDRAGRLRQDDSRRARWRSRGSTCRACVLYGGSIAPGQLHGKDVTIQDVFEAVGAHGGGQDERRRICARSKTVACPGAGACGGQFTANTMAIAVRVPRHRGARQRQRAGQRSEEGRRRRARPASA